MHPAEPGIVGLVLQVGRTATAGLDLAAMLSAVCAGLPAALGGASAAIVLSTPPDSALAGVSASDGSARRLGELELRTGSGPIGRALRSRRPVVTPDLRIGPPELAAAAADTGLTCSVTAPLIVDGEAVGGVEVFGHPGRPVGEGHAGALAGLADTLVARLMDAFALRRLTGTVARLTAEHEAAIPIAHATGMLAERYRTDIEEAGRFLGSRARATGRELADAAIAVIDRVDPQVELPGGGVDVPTAVVRAVPLSRQWGSTPESSRAVEQQGGRRRLREDQQMQGEPERRARHRRADIV